MFANDGRDSRESNCNVSQFWGINSVTLNLTSSQTARDRSEPPCCMGLACWTLCLDRKLTEPTLLGFRGPIRRGRYRVDPLQHSPLWFAF